MNFAHGLKSPILQLRRVFSFFARRLWPWWTPARELHTSEAVEILAFSPLNACACSGEKLRSRLEIVGSHSTSVQTFCQRKPVFLHRYSGLTFVPFEDKVTFYKSNREVGRPGTLEPSPSSLMTTQAGESQDLTFQRISFAASNPFLTNSNLRSGSPSLNRLLLGIFFKAKTIIGQYIRQHLAGH